MGNCQAAEVSTVLIQHPNGTTERVYWSISASHVMASNPGHYVAIIIKQPSSSGSTGESSKVKHLKLLRPDDTLVIGQVYRLVSFEEVVRKFETKRHAKLSKLVEKSSNKERSNRRRKKENQNENENENEKRSHGRSLKEEAKNLLELKIDTNDSKEDKGGEEDEETDELVLLAQALIKRSGTRPHQWRPALQTISEVTDHENIRNQENI